jgi:hypothetical protein
VARWQHNKQLDEYADFMQGQRSLKAVYKNLISYLNRNGIKWNTVEARLDLLQPEPLYNEIVVDGVVTYADQQLIDECQDVLVKHNEYTFSDRAIAVVEIDIDRAEPLGSFSSSISYLVKPR